MDKILNDLFIIPDFDNSKAIVTFTSPQGCAKFDWQILGSGKAVVGNTIKTKGEQKVSFEAEIKNFKPWDIDTPYLYQLKLSLEVNGKTMEVLENFGMRKIHATKEAIYVNNEKFYAKGYIRGREAHDHPNLEGLDLEEYYAKNIRQAKKYGFNFIRFHSKVPPEECFIAADKLGIFIHVEIRKYFGKYQKERQYMRDDGEIIDREEWAEVIRSLRNHPSLMVYCMGNEIRHPGHNPYVAEISKLTKEIDPTRFFIDTCAHGEFDRDNVDIDVQHMSYFYPFGKDYDMFENTYNWFIYGSAKGVDLIKQKQQNNFLSTMSRTIPAKFPILAHEVCHYTALRDIYALNEKFEKCGAEKPWWIDELKKLIKLKGMEKDYPQMMAASKRFQFLGWKLGLEGARRSSLLCGFHFLQLSDTERYENSNGVIDCFDDDTGVDENEFLKFNSDAVILADLSRRTYFENESISIPVILSHYCSKINGDAKLEFSVLDKENSHILISDTLEKINLDEKGRCEITQLQLNLPSVKEPKQLTLELKLIADNDSFSIENNWDIWLYPNNPKKLTDIVCTVQLDDINLALRYPNIEQKGTLQKPEKLIIVNRFSKPVFEHLENGGDVLMLYRVPQTRDRKVRAEKEQYYLPTTWDRFKGIIWDRGTNCGAFIRKSKALDCFPNDGFINLQFHGLIDDCDKIILDDFPCDVQPIIQGVDKATRDRFDVYTFGLSEFQPEWTMRKFAYLFELKVGKGRLFVSGFNFTGINSNKPETCAMFESILKYVTSDSFQPKASISTEQLEAYLLQKGKEPIIKERQMTQYWQLDDSPLESDQYWKDAEDYIRNR
ncbi:MAG: glycoside hydrolase family 2 TIM barrel-domain containing protein [Planctomycetota bacterium]|jgi:hypothetical protein